MAWHVARSVSFYLFSLVSCAYAHCRPYLFPSFLRPPLLRLVQDSHPPLRGLFPASLLMVAKARHLASVGQSLQMMPTYHLATINLSTCQWAPPSPSNAPPTFLAPLLPPVVPLLLCPLLPRQVWLLPPFYNRFLTSSLRFGVGLPSWYFSFLFFPFFLLLFLSLLFPL